MIERLTKNLRERVGKQTRVGELLGERARRLDGGALEGGETIGEDAGVSAAERTDPQPVQV